MKTNVYIDGFNFYYGAVKGTSYKWVNIRQLCELLLPKHEICDIKYFTAHVKPRPTDPDQHIRQQIYLRALRTLPRFEIILGRFLSHNRWMHLAHPPSSGPQFAEIIYTEEKGSDVNLATHLLWDGFQKRYEAAALITNDSDLVEPIRVVRRELGLDVVILNPQKTPSIELKKYASFIKQIRTGALAASQFPPVLRDAKGDFHKPANW